MSTYVVMGANYGDEGKGACVRGLADKLKRDDPKSRILGIKHNGGAQAGHTADGFVYHQISSGNIPTYLSEEFLFNPMSYLDEEKKLTIHTKTLAPHIFIHENCRITTPIDILMNQITETIRSKDRHGSCGMGIQATIERTKTLPLRFQVLMTGMNISFTKKLLAQRYYGFIQYLDLPEMYKDISISRLLDEFFKSLEELQEIQTTDLTDRSPGKLTIIHSNEEKEFLSTQNWDHLIFEGAQGLLLDKDALYEGADFPHVTPTKTDCTYPAKIIKDTMRNDQIFPVYCTRTYITRHGAGRLDKECKKEDLFTESSDKTNIPNEWQGTLRYAYFSPFGIFISRIDADKERLETLLGPELALLVKRAIVYVSWTDVTDGKFIFPDMSLLDGEHLTASIEEIRETWNRIDFITKWK